jgi:hypothetical protein
MSDPATLYDFEIHHIFPEQLYDDTNPIAQQFLSLMASAPVKISFHMNGNKIALYTHPEQAAAIRKAIAAGSRIHIDAGWGGSQYSRDPADRKGYDMFVMNTVAAIVGSKLSVAEKINEIYALHYFLREVCRGTITYQGAAVGVVGSVENEGMLMAAGKAFRPKLS